MTRKYSIDEIDRMRLLLRGRMGNGVDPPTDEAGLEARVRTYLTAGTDPDELSSALRSAIIAKWERAVEIMRQIKPDQVRKGREASAALSLENKLRVYGMEPHLDQQTIEAARIDRLEWEARMAAREASMDEFISSAKNDHAKAAASKGAASWQNALCRIWGASQ